jgi:hypothetical protein
VKSAGARRAAILEEVGHGTEGGDKSLTVQPVVDFLPPLFGGQYACGLKYLQVMRYCRTRKRQMCGDVADIHTSPATKQANDFEPGGVPHGIKKRDQLIAQGYLSLLTKRLSRA